MVELVVVIAIIAILMAIALGGHAGKRRAADAQVRVVIYTIAEKGMGTGKPIYITNGWYYVSGLQANVNGVLAELIVGSEKLDDPVYTYPISSRRFGSWNYASTIRTTIDQLGITNGYFVKIGDEQ